jgi:hypothetical protein
MACAGKSSRRVRARSNRDILSVLLSRLTPLLRTAAQLIHGGLFLTGAVACMLLIALILVMRT